MEGKKLRAEKLIKLFLQVPERKNVSKEKILELVASFRNNTIYINKHLSPFNRRLFAQASSKKRELNFKFLWTRQGCIFLQRNERSLVFKIVSEEDLNNLYVA